MANRGFRRMDVREETALSKHSTRGIRASDIEWTAWDPSVLDEEDIVAGTAEMSLVPLAGSSDGRSVSGVWRCSVSTYRVVQPWDEILIVLRGAMAYTTHTGDVIELGQGDMILLEEGAEYLIEVREPVETFWTVWSTDAPVSLA